MRTSSFAGATCGMISAPFVPWMACGGNIANSASFARWSSVRCTTVSPAARARASSLLMTGMIHSIEGPQYSAPAGSAKSWIMSTTSRARFVLVRAGLRGAGLLRGPERLSAAAARDRVRVAQREPAAHERVDEVDLGALDVHRAHRVDDDANPVLLDERVVLFAALREGHAIGEAAASARRDVDAQGQIVAPLLRDDFLELLRGPRGHRDDRLAGPGHRFLLLDRHVSPPVI